MKFRADRVSISSVFLTICLLSLVPRTLEIASTWPQRAIMVTERFWRYNTEASLAFASLALLIIGLIVIWTGYQRRLRAAWFAMFVFVFVYFLPVYLLDLFRAIRSAGWPWWREVVHDAMEGRSDSLAAIRVLGTFATMVIALLVPARAFFAKRPQLHSEDQSKEANR